MHVHSDHARPDARRPRLRALAAAALAAAAIGASSTATAGADHGQADLARVRAATARFHRIEVAEASGHQLGWKNPDIPITGCVAHPTLGAMGYHWFDHDDIEDISVDPLEPEGLVYEPLPNGGLRLVAVEWVVPADAWHAAGNDGPPTVLGQEMGILNPALGWYILHAWIWKPNPSGMFQNWNPDVSCP